MNSCSQDKKAAQLCVFWGAGIRYDFGNISDFEIARQDS